MCLLECRITLNGPWLAGVSGFLTESFRTKTYLQFRRCCGMNVPVCCCRGGVYVKRAILWRSSWMNGVDGFEALSRESLKYSPGSESGVPKTSSQANIQCLP